MNVSNENPNDTMIKTMKYNSVKEIVTEAPNYTQHRNNSHIHRYGACIKFVVNLSKPIDKNNQICWRL